MFKIILSMLLGLFIGFILSKIIFKPSIKYHGPNSNTIRKQIYHQNNGCYQLVPTLCIRPISYM